MREKMAIGMILLATFSCNIGEGEGYFHGCLFYPECDRNSYSDCSEQGENYTFSPGFFAAQSLEEGTLLIRIQKSGTWATNTDGFVLMIPDYRQISKKIDEEGAQTFNLPHWQTLESLPQSMRMRAAYFLNETCPDATASFATTSGTLILKQLYRPDSENEWIEGELDITFEDTRPIEENEKPASLHLRGEFRFKYARGVPAQYFP